MSRNDATTTEEHRPPSADPARAGKPTLLAAFPKPLVIPVPSAGSVGRPYLSPFGLFDSEISSSHCKLTRERDHLVIEDTQSRNGTWVDSKRLAPGERHKLDDGAIVRLGKTLFVVRMSYAGPDAPSPPIGPLVAPFGLGELRDKLERLKRQPERNVLITGETGSGKELCAAAVIHALGKSRRFVNVNVAAVPATLFEAQLFGWVKGAFSGATEANKGLIVEHDGGALFLDEIGELPLEMQPKLLRLLENREVIAVGSRQAVNVDIAVVAATNRLLDDPKAPILRRDLLARFAFRITLPPLRERAEDVYAILDARAKARGSALQTAQIEVEAVERIVGDGLPNNTRDLDRILANASGGLTLRAVEQALGPKRNEPTIDEIKSAVKEHGSQEKAAQALGILRGKVARALRK